MTGCQKSKIFPVGSCVRSPIKKPSLCLGDEMGNIGDLKSPGQKCPCGFESHPRHKSCLRRPVMLQQTTFRYLYKTLNMVDKFDLACS